jgi:hypothetical protein
MKTVEELKVGDICYWFSTHGEFEREVKVTSIEVDDDRNLGKGYYVKIEHQGTVSVRKNITYGHSIDFPSMLCFFSKESAVNYFIGKIEERVSTLKNSITSLYGKSE